MELPWWFRGKESASSAGDTGSVPGTGRSPGEGNGNPCQDSHPGNPKERGVRWAAARGSERVGHDLATKRQDQLHHLPVSLTSKPGTLLTPDASFQRVY